MAKLLENSRKDHIKVTAHGMYQTWAGSFAHSSCPGLSCSHHLSCLSFSIDKLVYAY